MRSLLLSRAIVRILTAVALRVARIQVPHVVEESAHATHRTCRTADGPKNHIARDGKWACGHAAEDRRPKANNIDRQTLREVSGIMPDGTFRTVVMPVITGPRRSSDRIFLSRKSALRPQLHE